MPYQDLRDWIAQAEKMGELVKVKGVDWRLELGALSDASKTAVLFDEIKDYPKGYRVLTGQSETKRLTFFTHNLRYREGVSTRELVELWRQHLKKFKAMPTVEVKDGPVMENVHRVEDDPESVDLLEFPVPLWHEEDGGRYMGTATCFMVRDPDEGFVNMGTFRQQVMDPRTLSVFICHGKNSHIIVEKYFRRGQKVPVVVLVGQDPAVYAASHEGYAWGTSDLDYAGWMKKRPIEVIRGPYTGLPIPADTEIAIEGEITPGDMMVEGPYGEWTGMSEPRPVPVIRVKAIYHRNDPIHTGTLAGRGNHRPAQTGQFLPGYGQSAQIWNQMEAAGVRGIQGVAVYTRFLIVVSIKQMFAGHARQAGHIASNCYYGSFMNHFVIVVDDDIDPYNIAAVTWAMVTRVNPERAIDILRYCWSDRMDPAIPYEEKTVGYSLSGYLPVYNSRAIIDACKPFDWDPKLKRGFEPSPELRKLVLDKYGDQLKTIYK